MAPKFSLKTLLNITACLIIFGCGLVAYASGPSRAVPGLIIAMTCGVLVLIISYIEETP